MTRKEIKEDFIKHAKYGKKILGIKINFPAFMFKKKKAELWDKDFYLRKRVYKQCFVNDQISVYDFKDWIEDEYGK